MPERWADAAEAPRGGRLDGVSVLELVWRLSQARATGVFRVDCDGRTKALHFSEGRIVFATSQDPDDRLGVRLLERGAITLDALERALDEQERQPEPWRRLGQLLVASGGLEPQRLTEALLAQLREITLDVLARERGEFHFERGPLPTDEPILLHSTTHDLIVSAIGAQRSVSRLRRAVGGSSAVCTLAADARERAAQLGLGDADEVLLERLEVGPCSVDALCRDLLLPDYEVLQRLWFMKLLGLLESGSRRAEGALGPSFVELLVELARGRESGVLHACRGSVERTFRLRQGRCTFAASSDPDDSLLAHLLRRGKITLREAEESVNRLLTSKRVGAMLLELGAIEADELQALVREQMLEIVCDTFGWEQADFRFVAGTTEHAEEIELELSPEALVREGVRRIPAWRRLAAGCGGPDEVLALSPDYLAVLDAMHSDVEEWDVVAALREPRSVRDLARRVGCGATRLGQIVWTLRLLGALRPAQAADAVPFAEPRPAMAAAASAGPAVELELELAAREAPGPAAGAAADEPPAPAEVEAEAATGAQGEAESRLATDELEREIERFNAMQRVIYAAVRAEVGAGAANVIRGCCIQGAEPPAVLGDSPLLADGSWDALALKRAAASGALADPGFEYAGLIRQQLGALRPHLAAPRHRALEQQIESLARVERGPETA